jgi:hypothetical protein
MLRDFSHGNMLVFYRRHGAGVVVILWLIDKITTVSLRAVSLGSSISWPD